MQKIIISIFILRILFSPLSVLALGQMTESIIITNALRGNEYQELLIAVNTDNATVNVSFSTEGAIANWAKFYLPEDLKNIIETVDIDPKQNKNIVAVFTVPADTPNGEYSGLVSVIKKPEAISVEEGSSSNVAQKIDREVSITVGGEEQIGLQVSVIPKSYDLKKGESLDIRFIFDNLGNVSLRPQIDLKIKNNSSGNVVYNAIYPYPESEPAVRPNAQYEIPAIAVPTNNLENGRYLVEVDFLHNNAVIYEKDFRFSIVTGGIVAGIKTISLRIFWPIIIALAVILLGLAVILFFRKTAHRKPNNS